ncbi:hypothetical protein E2P64_00060 [Candidatus Bathyarchaeota archaeon]|nr:hypothetical protein E2P64_00060 [Candidatus Bathyarchaeota archaeon]
MTSEFIKPDKKSGVVVVKIKAEVFPIDLVYTAAHRVMERAYVILDGSPSEEVYAILKPRKYKGDLEELGRIFYDELIAAAFHTVQFVRNKEMREALVASLAEGRVAAAPVVEQEEPEEDFDEKDIATLWEDKFGEGSEGSNKKKG